MRPYLVQRYFYRYPVLITVSDLGRRHYRVRFVDLKTSDKAIAKERSDRLDVLRAELAKAKIRGVPGMLPKRLLTWFAVHGDFQTVPHPRLDDCWEWGRTSAKQTWSAHCTLAFAERKRPYAIVAEIMFGKKEEGKTQDNHHCDNCLCIRPSHLYRGTQEENMRDMLKRGRHWSQNPKKHATVAGKISRARLARGRAA